ncbi:UNVERIFIED_CONTAM: hypothetical protein K2H54_044392 [Gekko kuhli]
MHYSHHFKELSFLLSIVPIGWVPGRFFKNLTPMPFSLEKFVPQRCSCPTSLPVKIVTQTTAVYKKRKKLFKVITELHHNKCNSTPSYVSNCITKQTFFLMAAKLLSTLNFVPATKLGTLPLHVQNSRVHSPLPMTGCVHNAFACSRCRNALAMCVHSQNETRISNAVSLPLEILNSGIRPPFLNIHGKLYAENLQHT